MRLLYPLLYMWLVTAPFKSADCRYNRPSFRENTNAVPVKYVLTLEPDLDNATFVGNVTIDLQITRPANNITLHASQLIINKESIELKSADGVLIPVSETEASWYREYYTIIFQNELLQNEKYELTVSYAGVLNSDNEGFYLAKYQDENGSERNLGNGRVLDVFRETCNMSTYLVAFTIFDFKHTEKNGIHRIFARPQAVKEGKAEYALKRCPKLLDTVQEYLDMEYDFPKIDHVAVPDEYFRNEALENWGLITYNEKTLLYSNKTTTTANKHTGLTSIIHEFIHQWFGNLVTPSQWEYLWLSEGLATYLQFRIGDTIEPSWKLLEQFITVIQARAFEGDVYYVYSFTRTSLNDEDQPIWVAYLKGAVVIKMVEHFLTPEIFRNGLQNYLKGNKFGSTTPSDLYAAFQAAVDGQGANSLLGNNTVSSIMRTWDSFDGYPIVNVTRNYVNGKITLEQKQFSPYEFMDLQGPDPIWYIPINYVMNAESEKDFTNTTADYWLTEKIYTLQNNFTADGWLIINKQFAGYYRVNYDKTNWNRLISFLNGKAFQNIHVLNRGQLIDDSFDLAKSGNLDFEIPLNLSRYLLQERSYVPFSAFFNAIEPLHKFFSSSDVYTSFKYYVISLLRGIREYLGYDERLIEDPLDKLNRLNVLKWLCTLGDPECRQITLNKLRTWKLDDSVFSSPDLLETTLCGAMRTGNQEDWDFLYGKYETATESLERSRFISALGCSENESVLTRFLEKIRDTNSTLRHTDRIPALTAIVESGKTGLSVARDYIRQHFGELWRLGSMDTILVNIGSRLTTKQEYAEFREFKNKYDGEQYMAFRPGLVLADMNLEWRLKYFGELAKWFNSQIHITTS